MRVKLLAALEAISMLSTRNKERERGEAKYMGGGEEEGEPTRSRSTSSSRT